MALLSWADATGRRYSMPCSSLGCMVSGQKLSSLPSMDAPISRSGFITRPIGRFWMEASPFMVEVKL